jgi:ATP-dependent DNA helicase PIF1
MESDLSDLNAQQEYAFRMYESGKSFSIVGAGGVGKSFVLNKIIKDASEKFENREPGGSKRFIGVTATTGISACLLNGTTLHSWGHLGLAKKPAKDLIKKIKNKGGDYLLRWMECKLLIIDEISMLSAELFEKIHDVACGLRKNDFFFGGIQVILSGDFAQLPPIDKKKRVRFTFESDIWKKYVTNNTVYLTEIVRQSDPVFQEILTQSRMGYLDKKNTERLKKRVVTIDKFKVIAKKMAKETGITPTILYPHNADVDRINNEKLDKLINKGVDNHEYYPEYKVIPNKYLSTVQKKRVYATIIKEFDHSEGTVVDYPPIKDSRANRYLQLAIGCQVILTHNLNVSGKLVNGSKGVVIGFDEDDKPRVHFDNGSDLTVEKQPDVTEMAGCDIFVYQYPLKLAYCLTIHKSQGMTIPYMACDLSRCFSPGQGYTALGRGRDLSGLYLMGLNISAIKCHPLVKEYYSNLSYKCNYNMNKNCASWKERSRVGSPFSHIQLCNDCLIHLIKYTYKEESVCNNILKHLN